MSNTTNIVLIGYMASGKTTIGKELAKRLKRSFIDLDDYITEKEELSISELFDQKGETYFRKKEVIYLEELLEMRKEIILSVGGGTPCFEQRMELINKKSVSIYLFANVETLYKRLVPKNIERPILDELSKDLLKEYITNHLTERSVFYDKAAIRISVDDLSVDDIVKNSIKAIENYSKKA